MEVVEKHTYFVEKLGTCLTANCLVSLFLPDISGFPEDF